MSERPNIRGVFWEDSLKQVSETEKWEKHDSGFHEETAECFLSFTGQIFEYDFHLVYYFQDNSGHAMVEKENLGLVRMTFLSERMPKSEVDSLFSDLEDTLKEKYEKSAFEQNFGKVSRIDYDPNGKKITKRVIDDSEECIDGKTVIELSAYPDSDYEDSLWKIEIIIWENGNGGMADGGRYQKIEIDKNKKYKWLKKQALNEL